MERRRGCGHSVLFCFDAIPDDRLVVVVVFRLHLDPRHVSFKSMASAGRASRGPCREANASCLRSSFVISSKARAQLSPRSSMLDAPIVVSAPGKLILFGEHAVVHGVTSLAASVGLRCYGLVQPRSDDTLHLELPDLGVSYDWKIAELPWNALPQASTPVLDELDPILVDRIGAVVQARGAHEGHRGYATSVAFLYHYMLLSHDAPQLRKALSFTVRSLLPIGAGLGSSASYSACLSSALLYTLGHLPLPAAGDDIARSDAEKINTYAFLAEKVIHGTPSGVDNSVAVFGGCLAFTRPQAPRNTLTSNELKLLPAVQEKHFLLTDTGVPRDTKSLVANVRALLQAGPARVNGIFDEIQCIVDEATTLLAEQTEKAQKRLGDLINSNHELLAQLQVSHPALESIRTALKCDAPEGLPTKLTGAGGGGCAVSLLPADLQGSTEKADSATMLLQTLGFRAFPTTVGGRGTSVLAHTAELELDSATTRFATLAGEQLGAWLEGDVAKWSRV